MRVRCSITVARPASDHPARVLIFAPVGRDAALTHDLLRHANVPSVVCSAASDLCAEIAAGAAAIVLTEETLEFDDFGRIREALTSQPPWSDIAVLLFASASQDAGSTRILGALEQLPNVTLLDRPVRVAVALSIVRAAVRARARQLEVRDLLQALDAAREQAVHANRLKDEFLATLSHELRTPMNAILGWITMLRQEPADVTRVQRGLDVIDRNARVQAQLVDDILDVARVITGKLRLEMKPVALTEVIDAAIQAMGPAADMKQLTLDVDSGADGIVIRGDSNRLQQVFWNLLSNAVKFTPAGGAVTIRARREGHQVLVSIADNGIGIDPKFLPYVFDRFRQADQTVTRVHGGLGLGLAIVKHLVELHGGSVTVTSEGIGRGTTFVIQLPVPADLSKATADDDRRDRVEVRGGST
jgi:signal transduction histidine kinase